MKEKEKLFAISTIVEHLGLIYVSLEYCEIQQ